VTPARIAPPLPECLDCGDPVRRDTAAANAGRCTDCRLRHEHATSAQLELVGLEDPEVDR
jgi:hypothetical protein